MACRSPWARVSSSASSAPTAPARPRPSRWSRVCAVRTPGRSGCSGRTRGRATRACSPGWACTLQASAFFEKLTAREQLQTFGALYGVSGRRMEEMLELVGLTDRAATREDRLSGGQRQRLSIACALVHEPELVFFDEPTAALDPQARRNLWDVLRQIRSRGTTIVYTTHYLDEAEALCDRVAILDAGRVLALDTPAALVRALHADTRVALPAGALPEADARALPGVDRVQGGEAELVMTTRTPAVLVQALAARDRLDGVSVRTATLEDVFLHLTGREFRA